MYTWRPATDADYEFLYSLHVAAMKALITEIWGWDEAWQADYFKEKFDASKRKIILVNGKPVGVIMVEKRENEHFLDLIEILPEFQSQGIGSAVIRDFIRDAHEHGRPATLNVHKKNPLAQRLYRRLGFQVIHEEEARYKLACFPPDS